MKNLIIVIFIGINILSQGQTILIKNKYRLLINDTVLYKNVVIGNEFREVLTLLDEIVGERDSLFDISNTVNSRYCIDLLNLEFETKLFYNAKFIRYSLFNIVNKNGGQNPMFVTEFNFQSADLEKIFGILDQLDRNYFISETGNEYRYFKWKNSLYLMYYEGLFKTNLEDFYQSALLYKNSNR